MQTIILICNISLGPAFDPISMRWRNGKQASLSANNYILLGFALNPFSNSGSSGVVWRYRKEVSFGKKPNKTLFFLSVVTCIKENNKPKKRKTNVDGKTFKY